MDFLKNIFSFNNKTANVPDIQFGRYSDSYKAETKYDAWDKSLELFSEELYLDSYRCFFQYLSDDDTDNVSYKEMDGIITYSLYQGSKLITGKANHNYFSAEVKVASYDSSHIGIFRKLLEDNFHLKYSKYAIDGNKNITLVFNTSSLDGSPYKLYYALKELSTIADKTDDVLIDKYPTLNSINTHHIREISEEEKKIKFDYFKTSIEEVLGYIDNTDFNLAKHPGALSYLYLDLAFRLDYLLKPEGYTMESIAKINHLYFRDKVKTIDQKNQKINQRFQELKEMEYTDFAKEVYEIKSTFGTTTPSGQTRFKDFILSEIPNMDWYCKEGHEVIGLAIPSYIVGYCYYNFAMPGPLQDLIQIYYKVIEYPYFDKLEFNDQFVRDNKSLDKKRILRAVESICKKASERYEEVKPAYKAIEFSNIHSFAKSYLIMVGNLEFIRKDRR